MKKIVMMSLAAAVSLSGYSFANMESTEVASELQQTVEEDSSKAKKGGKKERHGKAGKSHKGSKKERRHKEKKEGGKKRHGKLDKSHAGKKAVEPAVEAPADVAHDTAVAE